MEIIVTTEDKLEDIVSKAVERAFKNQQPAQPELPDRIGPKEILEITGRKMSWLYKKTSTGAIPFEKFDGRELVFSRKEIMEWMESNTKPKTNPEAIAANHLAKEAQKKL